MRRARGERVEIDYWSAGRDELTTRRIDPALAFFAMGEWYVSAYCHRANGERMFRVDRIRGLRATGEQFEPAPTDEIAEVFTPAADDPRVTLELDPSAAWVADAYPAESITTRADGTLEVELAISEPAWLERLLVRLGPEARVDPTGIRPAGGIRRGSPRARALSRPLQTGLRPVDAELPDPFAPSAHERMHEWSR